MSIYSFTYIRNGKEEIRLIVAKSKQQAREFFKRLEPKLTNQTS